MLFFLIFIFSTYYIMKSCDSFEIAANYLGRHMPNGMKGATLNAVGSSLPELMTTVFFLFLYHDVEGFSSGVATCAGSSIYNMIIIPGLCFLAVYFIGIKKQPHKARLKIKEITIEKQTLIRDGLFFFVAQLVLIYVLSQLSLSWWSGLILMISYILYLAIHFKSYHSHQATFEKNENFETQDEICQQNILSQFLTCNFHQLFFSGQSLNNLRAWIILIASIVVMGIACYGLTEVIYVVAQYLGIESLFAAIILAAAATSIPDTILSIKDALNGNFDDAFSNAFGSNIFNITIGIGLPLFFYTLIYGPITLQEIDNQADIAIRSLQIFIFLASIWVFAIFFIQKNIGFKKIISLITIYLIWILFVFAYAFKDDNLLSLFSFIFWF